MTNIRHEYALGETVYAPPETHGGSPRRAVVTSQEPYRGRPGYRVRYTEATEQWHSHSGWQPEACLRRTASASDH